MNSKFAVLIFLSFVQLKCRPESQSSKLQMDVKARGAIGLSREFRLSFEEQAWFHQRSDDWISQRIFAEKLWKLLWQRNVVEDLDIPLWQTWYSADDFQRIFRDYYSRLSVHDRELKTRPSLAEVTTAIRNDSDFYAKRYGWTREDFRNWINQFSDSESKRGIFSLNHILFNRAFLEHIMINYPDLFRCFLKPKEICDIPPFPPESIMLKTVWRRHDDFFSVPFYDISISSLNEVWDRSSWEDALISNQEIDPPSLAKGYRIRTKGGTSFLLSGMHLAYRLRDRWFWSSLWLCESESCPLNISENPDNILSYYQMCTVSDFTKPRYNRSEEMSTNSELFTYMDLLQERFPDTSWCSNPYLEPGTMNHKTNCIGCHQYAGQAWDHNDFTELLRSDPFQGRKESKVISSPHFVWSLNFGPKALAPLIGPIVEHFDDLK